MGDLDALVAEAKERMGAVIQKPKLTEKLLAKPPFRFLHDVVSAVTSSTGFGEGLYGPDELDSAAITEKNAKMAYLDKIFLLVGICRGAPLDVKSLKVVQGLEAEYTNQFLIALAECANNMAIDSEEAVRRTLRGEAPGQSPPPMKRGLPAAEAKSNDGGGGGGAKGYPDDRKGSGMDSKDLDNKLGPDMIAPERGKSRGGTRGGKPNQSSADVGLSGLPSNAMMPNLDEDIEKCDGTEATTQTMLGAVIQRPKLTEKLLAKPPFRFLHDIVMEIIKTTGFASGLYADNETDSASVTDKNQKLLFLEKIIKVVGMQLSTLVAAKPVRIVAGLDPQLTNNFLQLLALAATRMPDSRNAVKSVLEQVEGGGAEAKDSVPEAVLPQMNNRPVAAPQQQQQVYQPAQQQQQQAPEPRQMDVVKDDRVVYAAEDKEPAGDGEGGDVKRSARPTTARRRPPKVKDATNELQSKDTAPAAARRAEGIIIDGAANDDDMDGIPDESNARLADEMRAESKGSGGSGSGPAQSKLVQDIMSRQAEQEAAASRGRGAEAAEEAKGEGGTVQGGSGIRLTRMKKTGSEKKLGSGAAAAAVGATGFGEGDLEKMRGSVQALVQQTGPMGVTMDFITEDISLMTAELHKWEEECSRYEVVYEDAKRATKEALHPLRLELADLEDQIAERISKISQAKAANARNDAQVQQMLKLMATA